MKILFLGDVVGVSGRTMVFKSLLPIIKDKKLTLLLLMEKIQQTLVWDLQKKFAKIFLIVE